MISRRFHTRYRGVAGGLAIVGVTFLVWAAAADDPYWVSVLIEIGAGVALFAGLYVLQREVLERRVERVEERASEIANDVAAVRTEVRGVQTRLEELGNATRRQVDAAITEDDSAFEDFHGDVSAATLTNLMQRVRNRNAMSRWGVRARVGSTWYWLGLSLGTFPGGAKDRIPPGFAAADANDLFVGLQDADGFVIDHWRWGQDITAEEMFRNVAEAMMREGEFPGASFDATEIMARIARTLEVSMLARSGRGPASIAPVIEVPNDQWAVYRTRCGVHYDDLLDSVRTARRAAMELSRRFEDVGGRRRVRGGVPHWRIPVEGRHVWFRQAVGRE